MLTQDHSLMARKLSRREMLRLSAATLTGALMAACTAPQAVPQPAEAPKESAPPQAPAQPVRIVATSQMGVQTWDGTLKRAKERYPNITLEVGQTDMPGGWSGYADLIITRIAGGEQLDLVMIAVEGIPLLSTTKILRPLDPFFDADPKAKDMLMNDTHELLRNMLKWKGEQMEFPFSWNNMVMYYNTKIFEEKGIDPPKPDWTWEDFLEICLKVADVKGTAEDLYAYSFWGGGMFGMCAWYFVNDTSPLTDDWRDSNMLDPKVAETLQFLADLILKYKVAPNPAGWDEWGQFHSSHLAMRTCGRWCIGGSMNAGFTTYDLQYQPHKSGPLRTVAGTDGWGMTTSCKNPDEAWQMLTLLSGPEASMDMVKIGGNIPTLRSVANSPEFKQYGPPNTAIFYESLDYADTVVSPPNFNLIEPLLNRHYQGIWNGEVTVEEAVRAAHEELQAEMDKLKEKMGDEPFRVG